MNDWINIDDKYPPDCTSVLMANAAGIIKVGMVIDCGEHYRLQFGDKSIGIEHWKIKVTHWTPLPDLPF